MNDRTKQQIADAYRQILAEGGEHTITVKDVVERANVSRVTFYYYFKDIYDMIDWMYRKTIDGIFDSLKSPTDAWRVVASHIISMAEGTSDHDMLANYQHLDRTILDRQLYKLVYDVIKRCTSIDDNFAQMPDADVDFFVQMTTHCIGGMVTSKLNHDFDVDLHDYIDRYFELIQAGFFKRSNTLVDAGHDVDTKR